MEVLVFFSWYIEYKLIRNQLKISEMCFVSIKVAMHLRGTVNVTSRRDSVKDLEEDPEETGNVNDAGGRKSVDEKTGKVYVKH